MADGTYEKAILVCGTGVGMAIVANRYRGVRAANCTDVFSARYSRAHNDTNVLTLGGRVIGVGLAWEIVNVWLSTAFARRRPAPATAREDRPAVKCPFCSHLESKVIDSRVSTAGDVIRRRRECESCARRFTSRERVEDVLPVVVKKDGRREPFDREKVLRGVRLRLQQAPRRDGRLERFIDELERELIESEAKRSGRSKSIGETVMQLLRELDEVAYVRFASVYRSFRDIEEFRVGARPDGAARAAGDADEAARSGRRRRPSDRRPRGPAAMSRPRPRRAASPPTTRSG